MEGISDRLDPLSLTCSGIPRGVGSHGKAWSRPLVAWTRHSTQRSRHAHRGNNRNSGRRKTRSVNGRKGISLFFAGTYRLTTGAMPIRVQSSTPLDITGASLQRVEQRLGLTQIRCVEALGEPAVDWGEQVASLGALALIAPQTGKAGCGAELR
jgi:hypothetical protein